MVFRVTVHLWQKPGAARAFRQFEDQAMEIMRGYGAEITVEIPEGAEGSDEIHHLTFPSPAEFTAYRQDQRLQDLAPLREKGVQKTALFWPDGPPEA